MGVVGQGVDDEVGERVPRQMIGQRDLRREHQAMGIDPARLRFPAQIRGREIIRLQQPQDAAFDLAENAHPDIEDRRRDLEAVVEAAQHERVVRQAGVAARRGLRRDRPLRIVDLVAVRQVDDGLGVERLLVERQHDPVGDDVVDEVGPHRSRIAEIAHLNRRRPMGQDARPLVLGMTLEVDRNVDLEVAQQARHLAVAMAA